MEKRLARSDFIFILGFIFFLVCLMGVFFLGMNIGISRAETKYQAVLKQKEDEAKGLPSYDQSYLVSFYHTVYSPFREFGAKYTARLAEIDNKGTDPQTALKELGKLADEKYNAIQTQTMPDTAPLLQSAHANYLKSLKLFSEASKRFESKANVLSPSVVPGEIRKDAYFTEASNFALAGQKDFYDSIVKWNLSVQSDLKGTELLQNNNLGLAEWKQLNLNLKNAYMAGTLKAQQGLHSYTPQDLTARVDEIISNGQATKRNTTNITQVVDLITGTDAVRPGDFIRFKNKWYGSETLPQLPFFTSPD